MHILLKTTTNHKGILILTHKELPFLSRQLDKLSKTYYLFVHYGFNCGIMGHPLIKYNMISDSRCIQNDYIPFTSRNFLSKHFNNNSNIKETNQNIKLILQKNNINLK